MAIIYIALCTVVTVIIFIIIVVIAVHLLALRHRYAATYKLHRAPLHCVESMGVANGQRSGQPTHYLRAVRHNDKLLVMMPSSWEQL